MRYYMTRAEFTAFIASPERASAIHQGLEVYITDEAGAPIQKYVDSAWVLVRNFEGSMPDSADTQLGVHKEVLTPVFVGTYSSGSQLLVDANGENVLAAMGMFQVFPSRKTKVAFVGDSITASNGAACAYPRSDWDGSTEFYTAISTPNLTDAFVAQFVPDAECRNGDSLTLTWDGVSTFRVAVAGDSAGVPVDVTGGGFFHLTSGTNGKGAVIIIRWANRVAATSDTGTVSSAISTSQYAHMNSWWYAGLAKCGFENIHLMNFGVFGDTPSYTLDRIGQVIAESPDIAFLMVGINAPSETSEIRSLIDALCVAVPTVVVVPLLPVGNQTTAAAQQAIANCWRETQIYARNKGNCIVYDLWRMLSLPNATYGTGCIDTTLYHTDYLHLNLAAGIVIGNDFNAQVLSKLMVNSRGMVASGSDTYNATVNPFGNLLGTVGGFSGTGGTLGASPTPTGSLGTNWTDSNNSSTYPFASVTYSKVARTDAAGTWQRVVLSTATGGTATRRIKTTSFPSMTALVGKKVRFRVALRLTDATLINTLQGMLLLSTATAYHFSYAFETGIAQAAGSTITDSGVLHFISPEIVVPSGISSAEVRFIFGCASTGSMTVDLGDVVVEPVE